MNDACVTETCLQRSNSYASPSPVVAKVLNLLRKWPSSWALAAVFLLSRFCCEWWFSISLNVCQNFFAWPQDRCCRFLLPQSRWSLFKVGRRMLRNICPGKCYPVSWTVARRQLSAPSSCSLLFCCSLHHVATLRGATSKQRSRYSELISRTPFIPSLTCLLLRNWRYFGHRDMTAGLLSVRWWCLRWHWQSCQL